MASTLALSCGTKIEQPQDVRGLRVIALLADAPEAQPGMLVRLRAVLGGASPAATLRWTVCARTEEASTSLPISSYGQFRPDEGCDGERVADVRTIFGRGLEAMFTVPDDALVNDAWLSAAFAGSLSPERRRELARLAGLPLVVTVDVTDGEHSLRAFKRLVIFSRERAAPLNSNPPTPVLSFGDRTVGAQTADPLSERCGPLDTRGPLTVPVGTRVLVTPAPDETWFESYTVLDAQGRETPVTESAFYNFFSTAGTWELGRARAPERNPTWIAPADPSTATLWVTSRDGRGGASACRFDVTVVAR